MEYTIEQKEHIFATFMKIVTLAQDPIFIEYIRDQLIDINFVLKKINLVEIAKRTVLNYYGRKESDLTCKKQERINVKLRYMTMNLLDRDNDVKLSLTEIGRLIGGKDHATVIHARKCLSDWIDTNERASIEFAEIEEKYKDDIKKLKRLSQQV